MNPLLTRSKKSTAAYIKAEYTRNFKLDHLHELLDIILNPLETVDKLDTVEWCRWLMAGGCTPDEFASTVRRYDNATTCGLVWTANFVAYRCRTCGISPCMSLCAECFQRGDHKGHDFNMFRSQAGGACDCGDTNVMKESGFCYLHGPHSQQHHRQLGNQSAPSDLLSIANIIMPRLFLRLLQFMRENSSSIGEFGTKIQSIDKFITMLHDLSSMGAAMRQVMTDALTNPQVYKNLMEVDESAVSKEYLSFVKTINELYESALISLPNPDAPELYKDIPSLQKNLVHTTFLEEFVFWIAKFEFPQKLVCLLLNLLPETDYKEAFTRAFVLHYSRISQLLVESTDAETLSNRVVHVSVQLFSNEKLALKISEQMGLLHVMVISLQYMMNRISIPSALLRKDRSSHYVVDCSHAVMGEHCYWPLVSDLNNILSHRPVALKFLHDDGLIQMWFDFLSVFQGMHVNIRELNQHVEYEPKTYYAAFSAELEASASPMWALVSHLRDSSTAHLTKNLLRQCRKHLSDWFDAISGSDGRLEVDPKQVSFHLPLHRYFSVFLCQAVRNQGLSLADLLPPPNELQKILLHPLRAQVAFYEIISGLWVRNGLQIKGQAMTYIQCHFCNSMVDADLYLIQTGMMNLPHGEFVTNVVDNFRITESLSISQFKNRFLEPDQEVLMLENCLVYFATLASVRTSIGVSNADLVSLEMITLMCMGDKTHSQLMELMPERCDGMWNNAQSRDFEAVLASVADYRAPNFESSGNMSQGMYVPKSFVWDDMYDPIYVLLRAVHRKDFQTSMDRFTEYVKQSGKNKTSGSLWPPFRIPKKAASPYVDPRHILLNKVFQGILFAIFYKLVHTTQFSDQVASLAVYLLEMALSVCDTVGAHVLSRHEINYGRYELDFSTYYSTDCLLANMCTEIDSVIAVQSSLFEDSQDTSLDDMEVESYDGSIDMFDETAPPTYRIEPRHDTDRDRLRLAIANIPIPSSRVIALRDDSYQRLMPSSSSSHNTTIAITNNSSIVPAGLDYSSGPLESVVKREILDRNSSSTSQEATEVVVNESMVSLLLKLHSKLSGCPDSYVPFWERTAAVKLIADARAGVNNGLKLFYPPESEEGVENLIFSYSQLYSLMYPTDDRIGDGPFFVAKVLDKMCAKEESSSSCRQHLLSTRERLWPKVKEDEEEVRAREEKEKEERRRRAKERQAKIMAEFALKQAQFMAKAMKEHTESEGDKDSNSGSPNNNNNINNNSPSSSNSGATGDPKQNSETEDEGVGFEEFIKPVEYDCVICNQTSASTDDNPMGLVILLQSTSMLGHRRAQTMEENVMMPTSDKGRQVLSKLKMSTMTHHNEVRLEHFKNHFEDVSWLMSISAGWEGGVHVQTCGHHLHMECLKSYLATLKTQQRQPNVAVDRGEYFCPFCRQLANSFLPLSPEFGIRQSALVKDRKTGVDPTTPGTTDPEIFPTPESNIALEVAKILKECPLPNVPSNMMEAMSKTMEEMTNATMYKYRQIGSSKDARSILLFVHSIARTNLELELVLRGGSLVSEKSEPKPSTSSVASLSSAVVSKRCCIVPLFHVLGIHYKILSTESCSLKMWERILGIRFMPDSCLIPKEREVPMLLRDPSTILLHLLMQLPMHVDLAYFTCIVQGIFNLVYIQVLCSLCCEYSSTIHEIWQTPSSDDPTNSSSYVGNLKSLVDFVVRHLGVQSSTPSYEESSMDLIMEDSDMSMDQECSNKSSTNDIPNATTASSPSPFAVAVNEKEVELTVQILLLPFLRIASLLQHHLYDQELPSISSSREEFGALCQFLNLGNSREMGGGEFVADECLKWITPTPINTVGTWVQELSIFMKSAQISSMFLVKSHHMLWNQPRLMELPVAYDDIFQYYHRKKCLNCHLVPRKPSLCLICGAFVCMSDPCCKRPYNGICEAIQHSMDCGAGTVVYLNVSSTTIVVVRGRRACLWGSVYLDSFGEEDRELKRGKPLFLSKERYALLQQQWLTHRFDHTNRRWIWHRDTL